ncbi:hypothetical protein RRG08_065430 [Elysia crispata]|uniref:PH domain-containing protein n=1 Tax=Elysia crispata TaxID=231223 RepID=A0AAE0ZEJ9_9GAST|nr:hypothetical protein RRG08_065430 [Elysia crispata]
MRFSTPEKCVCEAWIMMNGPGSEYTMASVVPRPMNHPTDLSDVMDRQKPTFDRDEMTGVADVTQQAMELEGFLEMRDGTGKWTRVQCRLKESSLVVNCIESETHPTPDVIDLTGCEVTELIDQFQGKRFVLRLEHQTAPPVLISLDSREDLALWKQNILASLNRARRVHAEPMPITSTAQWRSAGKAPPIEELHPQTSTSSAQSIKQKLLAEMLRQREELERMQTARAEMKAGQPQHPDALVLDEERIVALTRLRQRRMSTQIKLQAIQRQIESVHCLSPREKKSMFLPLGRKRAPDLLLQTQHAKEGEELVQQDSRAALEAQVKSLSSQLHDLDENISSHEGSGLASPRDEASSQVFLRKHSPVYGQEILRHSLDPSCLSSSRDASIRDSVVLEDDHEDEVNVGRHLVGYDLGEDGPAGGALRTSGVAAKKESRGKETASSTSRSASGFKSSVQKLAHRTFSRATNWNWATKKTSSFSSTASAVASPGAAKDGVHSDNNNTIASLKQDRLYGEISTSFTTPDVIDMTTRGNDKLAMSSIRPEHRQRVSRDDSDIRTIPGSLDGDSVDGKSQDIAHKVHRTPKERILSKMVQSSSLSGINQFDARLQNFSSSSPDLASDGSHPHLHPVSGPQDIEYREHSGLRSSNMPQQTWRPSSLTLTASTSHDYRASPTATPPGGAANFTPSPRGSEGKVMTPRREVNPDALAQIEAFEELSLRYLGAAAK